MHTRTWTLVAAGFLVACLGVALARQAAAFTEAGTEGEDSTTTTTVGESGVAPAVPAPPAEEEDEEQPWTARFLAPTVLALGVVGLVAATSFYAVRIRGRYRVVD